MRTYVHDLAETTGTAVCVRRTPLGVLVCSHEPALEEDHLLLVDLLDRAERPLILEIRNDPGESDFDAPLEETARLLAALLSDPSRCDDVLVASRDWFAIEKVKETYPATGFISGPGVKVGGGLAYAASAGHTALIAHADMIEADSLAKAAESVIDLIAWGGQPAHPVDGVIT